MLLRDLVRVGRGLLWAAAALWAGCEGGFVPDNDMSLEDDAAPCEVDEDCDDGASCNGAEHCEAGRCLTGPRVICDDGIECTRDTCDETTDECRHTPDHTRCNGVVCSVADGCGQGGACTGDAECDDLVACNGLERCAPGGHCEPGDGGDCGPVCGDWICDIDEDCASCAADCGPCGPVCGDLSCDAGEDCGSCPADCGGCAAVCGNLLCEGGEDCTSCPGDCGACVGAAVCGNLVCDPGEQCGACAGDCVVDTCNGRDDDCDGLVDDFAVCAPGLTCLGGACIVAPAGCAFYQWSTQSYGVCWTARNWWDASNDCTSFGGHLVTIGSADEDSAVRSILAGDAWMGLYRTPGDCVDWFWSTGEALVYTAWGEGQPDNGCPDQECGHYWNAAGYSWDNDWCTTPQGYVCEWD